MRIISKCSRTLSRKMKKEKEKRELLKKRSDYKKKSAMECKEILLSSLAVVSVRRREASLIRYYKQQRFYKKYKVRKFVQFFVSLKIKHMLPDALRWIFVDLLRGRHKRVFGVYQFIALPGEGKTMSMVAHMERYRQLMASRKKRCIIATNFYYKHQDFQIEHWLDIVRIAHECYRTNTAVLIAMDEIHITFDSSEWKDFPAELLAVLSFCRKYNLQFLVSAQIYERIPKKIRDIANFTVVCRNFGHLDRLFVNYYYEKDSYEVDFSATKGKKKKSKFTRRFVAGDDFYDLYNTRQQVDRMVKSAKEEKKRRDEASLILYKNVNEEA